jgi:hypothetical protein
MRSVALEDVWYFGFMLVRVLVVEVGGVMSYVCG